MFNFDWLFPGKKRFDNFVETTLNSLAHQWYLSVTGKPPVDRVTDRKVLDRLGDLTHFSIILKPASGEGKVFTIMFMIKQVCKTSYQVSNVQIRFGNFEGTGYFFVRKDNGAFGGILLDPRTAEWMAHVVNGARSNAAFGDILQTHFKEKSHVFVPETGTDDLVTEGWQPPQVGDNTQFGRVFATVLRSMRVSKGWLVMISREDDISTVLIGLDGNVLKWDVAWRGDE